MMLTNILFGTFVPPVNTKTRVHRMDGKEKLENPMRIITEQLNSPNKHDQQSGEAKLRIYNTMRGLNFMSVKRIAKLAKSDNRTVQKALEAMKKEGLVKSKKVPCGYTKHYVYWKLCEQ